MTRLAIILALLCGPAFAQNTCAPHALVADALKRKHGEDLIGQGLRSETVLFGLFVNSETGTWSIVRMHINGTTCLMASGQNWESNEPEPQGTDG